MEYIIEVDGEAAYLLDSTEKAIDKAPVEYLDQLLGRRGIVGEQLADVRQQLKTSNHVRVTVEPIRGNFRQIAP